VSRPPSDRRAAARAGFTVVEVLMAVTILGIGLLALAGLGATSMRAVRGGSMQTVAAAVTQSRFDSLASVPCDQIAPANSSTIVRGVATTRGVTESWTAQRVASGNMVRVTDVVRVPGRTQSYQYMGMRACR
jgi:type IV pilus assembly protein PilV